MMLRAITRRGGLLLRAHTAAAPSLRAFSSQPAAPSAPTGPRPDPVPITLPVGAAISRITLDFLQFGAPGMQLDKIDTELAAAPVHQKWQQMIQARRREGGGVAPRCFLYRRTALRRGRVDLLFRRTTLRRRRGILRRYEGRAGSRCR